MPRFRRRRMRPRKWWRTLWLRSVKRALSLFTGAYKLAAVAGGVVGVNRCADFVVAAEKTKIGYPEVRRGLVAGLVMTFLRRQVGERNMRELLFSGDLIDAARAKEIGLVNRVVAPDDLMNEAQKFAASVLQGAPSALAQTKRLVEELWWRSVKEDVDDCWYFKIYHMEG